MLCSQANRYDAFTDPLQSLWSHVVIVRSASTVVWGTCETQELEAVVLVGEEAFRQRAAERRSKVIGRICIAIFMSERVCIL